MCSTSVWKCSLTSTRPRLLAHHVAAVDDRGPVPQLGRRDGRLLTGRTGADDGEVVGVEMITPSPGRRGGYRRTVR